MSASVLLSFNVPAVQTTSGFLTARIAGCMYVFLLPRAAEKRANYANATPQLIWSVERVTHIPFSPLRRLPIFRTPGTATVPPGRVYSTTSNETRSTTRSYSLVTVMPTGYPTSPVSRLSSCPASSSSPDRNPPPPMFQIPMTLQSKTFPCP